MRRIVLLQEGLGNQMFAYAFYLAMKKKYSDTAVSAYLFHRWSPHNGLEIDRLFGIDLEEKPMINFIVRIYRKLFYLSKKNNYGVFF